ncbi:DNA adenine methylase [Streptomyces sp. B1866]|uniref:DNA adenine methylase n=1 Tax=Streptomyces sp. B1866 TaxID=3075431 RepID=UPI00288D4454|nr:DNA adenine methylase [Streptomyces sp. B1866]MDT3395562.1 DNA adenine methylase [Streptomyces sp. B1866]
MNPVVPAGTPQRNGDRTGEHPYQAADSVLAARVAARFPRLRYMGSKHRLLPRLAEVFADIFADARGVRGVPGARGVRDQRDVRDGPAQRDGEAGRNGSGKTALDAFSGSGVVSYLLKSMGCAVTSNDFLNFPSVIARAAVVNHDQALTPEDVEAITGPAADDRDFIQSTFDGLYFTGEDRAFLDAAWSHIDRMRGAKRDLAIAALVLSAARKQPRGVFTVTGLRYDDGRPDLRLPLRDHFRRRAAEYSRAVFDSGQPCAALTGEVFDIPSGGHDVVYLDPPYAPPRDDNCYVKRYHFLEGLSVYWRGQEIMENTKTKKLAKKPTPFSSKKTVVDALARTFDTFSESVIVLSYSSNAVPDADTVKGLLSEVKEDVRMISVDHTYSFGTHPAAARRAAREFIFVGR